MKIVCYVNKLSDGGAERVMSVLANGLSRMNNRVILVTDYMTPNEYPVDPCITRAILDGEFSGVCSKGRITRTLRRIFQIRSICKKHKADIIVSFASEANFRAILATRCLNTKNLISVRVDPKVGYRDKKTAVLAKQLYPLADGCVFQTADAQAWFPSEIQKKSKVILNPVSNAFFGVAPAETRTKRIVSCGRLGKQKRFDLLIDAFNLICDDFPEYKLEIYGQGELQSELQAQIDSLGRQNRISLMGRCNDVPNTIRDASVFVLCSDFEGLPNALMEAMVLGIPVISTDCSGGGARALIDQSVNGRIVSCGDTRALADAIRAYLEDPEKADQHGKKAAEKATGFSTERIVAVWEAYIKEIVTGK